MLLKWWKAYFSLSLEAYTFFYQRRKSILYNTSNNVTYRSRGNTGNIVAHRTLSEAVQALQIVKTFYYN